MALASGAEHTGNQTEAQSEIDQIMSQLQSLEDQGFVFPDAESLAAKVTAFHAARIEERLLITDFDETLTHGPPGIVALGQVPTTSENLEAVNNYKNNVTSLYEQYVIVSEQREGNPDVNGVTLTEYLFDEFIQRFFREGLKAVQKLVEENAEIINTCINDGIIFPRLELSSIMNLFGSNVIISSGITQLIESLLAHELVNTNFEIIANKVNPPDDSMLVTMTNKTHFINNYLEGRTNNNIVLMGDRVEDLALEDLIVSDGTNVIRVLIGNTMENNSNIPPGVDIIMPPDMDFKEILTLFQLNDKQ